MAGFKKEVLMQKRRDVSPGVTTFYGVHNDTDAVITPEVSVPAPPNDLFGPHLTYIGVSAQKQNADESK